MARAAFKFKSVKLSRRAGTGVVRFREELHRRDPAGKFADKPGAGDDAPRKGRRGQTHAEQTGVGGAHRIRVVGGGRRYTDGMTVDDYVKSVGGDRTKALRRLARDMKAGRIKFEASTTKAAAPARPRSTGKGQRAKIAERAARERTRAPTAKPTPKKIDEGKVVGPIRQRPLSEDNTAALREYQHGDYANLNAGLRAGDDTNPLVRRLDSAIAQGTLERDVVLHRGLAFWDKGKVPNWKVGDKIKDRGFISTSTDPEIAANFAADTGAPVVATLRLRARAGTSAAYFKDYDGYDHHEVLLARNSSYTVTGLRRDADGNLVVEAELALLPAAGLSVVPAYVTGGRVVSPKIPPTSKHMEELWARGQRRKSAVPERAKAHGITEDEYIARVQTRVEELVGRASVWTRIPANKISSLVRDGRFRTQYETKKSKGLYNPDLRRNFENTYFNAGGVPDAERPIYGYLHESDDGFDAGTHSALDQYGSVAVRMRDSARERATWTDSDSLDVNRAYVTGGFGRQQAQNLPSPVNAPDARSHLMSFSDEFDVLNARVGKIQDLGGYTESQMWGGVRLEDIDEMVFADAADMERHARRLTRAGVRFRLRSST